MGGTETPNGGRYVVFSSRSSNSPLECIPLPVETANRAPNFMTICSIKNLAGSSNVALRVEPVFVHLVNAPVHVIIQEFPLPMTGNSTSQSIKRSSNGSVTYVGDIPERRGPGLHLWHASHFRTCSSMFRRMVGQYVLQRMFASVIPRPQCPPKGKSWNSLSMVGTSADATQIFNSPSKSL